jgi:Putative zinc-finger
MERNEQSAIVEMTCIEVRALITDYLDGDLGLDEYIRADAHLDHCIHCSAIYDGVRNVVALLAADGLFPVSSGLEERLHALLLRDDGVQGR